MTEDQYNKGSESSINKDDLYVSFMKDFRITNAVSIYMFTSKKSTRYYKGETSQAGMVSESLKVTLLFTFDTIVIMDG